MCLRPGWYLVLRDGDTQKIYASYPVKEGDSFAVGFIHSVNKSPVIDIYYIEDHDIYVEETIYYSFGAGVQTELNPGEKLDYGPDGAMIISNIHKNFQTFGLNYSVGVVSDHTMVMGDVIGRYVSVTDQIGVFPPEGQVQWQEGELEVTSLSALCGRKSVVSFTCEYRLFGI